MEKEKICECSFCLKEDKLITLMELKQTSRLTMEEIQELVDFGVLQPQGEDPGGWIFSSHCITIARSAVRLKRDFDLNPPGMALALTYLERILELETRLRELECQLLKESAIDSVRDADEW